MKRAVWISFDLGVRGDYEGMYAWLDKHEAKECGDSLAFVTFEFENDLPQSLTEDIKASVEVTKKTRIYAIWQDPESNKVKGCFIVGTRKSPAWAGYAVGGCQEGPDEA
jgi:hypothetical protein